MLYKYLGIHIHHHRVSFQAFFRHSGGGCAQAKAQLVGFSALGADHFQNLVGLTDFNVGTAFYRAGQVVGIVPVVETFEQHQTSVTQAVGYGFGFCDIIEVSRE